MGDGTTASAIDLSQRSTLQHHHVLTPQETPTVSMRIPFIFPFPWFDLANRSTSSMGTLLVHSLMPLRTAGTASTTTSTVTVTASFIDPELAGPTVTLQSATLQGVSKDLERAGLHQPAAWAGLAARAARLLGLTNYPSSVKPSFVVPNTFPALTNSEDPPPCDSLSLGSQVQLFSDPKPGADELDIATLAARPMYLNRAPWTISHSVGTQLFQASVTPEHYTKLDKTGAATGAYYLVATSPAAYVGSFFRYWRGTVCFKIKVLCSQHHRGKVRVFYDSAGVGVSSPAEAVIPSLIIDLAATTEATIRIPMNAQHHWLKTTGMFNGLGAANVWRTCLAVGTGGAYYDSASINGIVKAEVFQELSCPSDTGDVNLMIETWVEDAQFAVPMMHPPDNSWFKSLSSQYFLQSANAQLGDEDISTNVLCEPKVSRHLDECFGEDILSLRALIHRACFWRSIRPLASGTYTFRNGSPVFSNVILPRFPSGSGYVDGTDVDAADLTSSAHKMNFSGNYYARMVAAMFHGYKGSVRWRVGMRPDSNVKQISISMSLGDLPNRDLITVANNSSAAYARARSLAAVVSGTGGAVTSAQAPGITVDVPDYTRPLFLPTNLSSDDPYILGLIGNEYAEDTVIITSDILSSDDTGASVRSDNSAVDVYLAASPNFQVCHFKCIPILSFGAYPSPDADDQ